MTTGRTSRGFTMVEAVISIMIVSVMLVAALNVLGASNLMQWRVADRSKGLVIAETLMTEILMTSYADPVYGIDSFGRNATEAATGNRSLFDDVDDYDNWEETPAADRNGMEIAWAEGLGRHVRVDWVNPSALTTTVNTNMGIKRIVVEATRDGRPIAKLIAYRTQTWKRPIEAHRDWP